MKLFKSIAFVSAVSMILAGCEGPEPVELGPKQAWKNGDYLQKNQFVFTNEFRLKDGRGTSGGASFLVQSTNGPVLCTAKHLLSEEFGISPKVATSDFNAQIDFWKLFAKNDSLFGDTLFVSKMLSDDTYSADIIVLKCKSTEGENLLPLKPRFSRVNIGEELEIIGHEFGDTTGMQKSFIVELKEYDGGSLLVKSKSTFKPMGMSGSPVLDASGYVVGVLTGGNFFEGELYLSVEPLSLVREFIP
ncbi:MAG: trypsin-like peptidase domain-containing protein [Fluviicola sp.]